jgi:PAS domain S-box-containing protein
LFKKLQHKFSDYLQHMDLQGKITLALVLGSLLIGGTVALPAFLLNRHQLLQSSLDLLSAQAKLERQEIELRLSGVMSVAESLAANSITANALADSLGRETYLSPLLKNQKLPVKQASLTLTDYRGDAVAGSEASKMLSYRQSDAFAQMMQTAKPQARIENRSGTQGLNLIVMLPVIYRLSGNAEGAIVVELPLNALLINTTVNDAAYLSSATEDYLAGSQPRGSVLHASEALQLSPPLLDLKLVHTHTRDRGAALKQLDFMLGIFLSVGIALIILVVIASRQAANWLAAPLRQLALASEEIASTGRPHSLTLTQHQSKDEFGRLSTAFNLMVTRLRHLQEQLEQRVEERTRALTESETRLQYVMDATGEGVWDWDLRTNISSHNQQWCSLLGLDNSFLTHHFDVFTSLLHPDDHASVIAAIQASLNQNLPYHHEHRLCLADGRMIWVLDRGKVVEHDADGKPMRMVGSLMDITASKLASEQVRVRELYLRATLDNLPFLFWLKDAECRFLAVNRNFAKACGRDDPDQIAGLTDLDVWPKDLAEGYRTDDLEVIASRREKAVEETVETDGQRGWIETYKKPVIAADGSVLGTVGFARDITERKEMERALEISQQRWQLAVTGSKDGIWDWDIPSGEVFYSDQWLAMLGYQPGEIENNLEAWLVLIHPDDLDAAVSLTQRHLNKETPYFLSEFRMRRKDGEYTWIQSRGRALFDNAGNALRMTGSTTDITERRAAEATLRDRTEQLDAIFSLSPDGFISFDRSFRIKYVNAAFLLMAGFEADELVGLDEAAFLQRLAARCKPGTKHPDLNELRADLKIKARRASHRHLIELDSERRSVLEIGLRQSQADTVAQILFFRDVTRETEVDQMKSEFLSTAAHELRTPMASILGFSELLLHQEFEPEVQVDLLQTIYHQSELMSSILNELLDLARIEARGGKDFIVEDLSLVELLKHTVTSFSPPSGRQSPTLIATGDSVQIKADRKKLTQVISNVLSNAYKYSPNGGDVIIKVQDNCQQEDQWMTGFSIQDHGIGMAPAQLARVFERFYRADESGNIPGTGLGMSIVKEIVELHQGNVEISSQPGQGTLVTIWLPLTEKRA